MNKEISDLQYKLDMEKEKYSLAKSFLRRLVLDCQKRNNYCDNPECFTKCKKSVDKENN